MQASVCPAPSSSTTKTGARAFASSLCRGRVLSSPSKLSLFRPSKSSCLSSSRANFSACRVVPAIICKVPNITQDSFPDEVLKSEGPVLVGFCADWCGPCKLIGPVIDSVAKSIVSDRDPRMTSLFWKALFENMGTTLKFSSSFHPQTDGQSEEENSIVLDLLKCYVSEHKATWEHYLPLVKYAYNNTVHTSTGKASFEIVEGGKKVPPILQTKDKIFEADKYVQNTDEAYRKIKLALEKTQSKQKKAVDRHCRELVLRKIKGKQRLFPKLGMRYYGPFQVCDKISDVAYRLKLPEGWMIHNAFHVSLLRPFVGYVPEDMVPEEQPKVARHNLVKFKNYSPMDAKWMEEAELVDSPQLLQMDGRG
ncbi:hypothetical protein L7F22_014155 [Adiantum nelumboides]|nr:hypothetical protein [Adiantum nelumboides]